MIDSNGKDGRDFRDLGFMDLQRLVLVRHGETVGQSSIRYYGATDLALSDLGLRQMRDVARALEPEHFDIVLTSALQRTTTAAKLIAPATRRQAVVGFNEINFGDWEGLTKEEIAARDPAGFARWQADFHSFTYPGGDSVVEFRNRVAKTWRQVAATLPAHVLLIAHRGVILSIMTETLRLSDEERAAWPTALGSIHVLEQRAGRWNATHVNQTEHLSEAI